MAKYVNGKKVDEKKVSLTVNVFVKDDEVNEVTLGSHLGQGSLKYNEDDDEYVGLSRFRPNSKLPVAFFFDELGVQKDVEVQAAGMHEKDVVFNALAWLDEPEKVEALTDDEREELRHIGVVALNQKVITAIVEHKPTAMSDAAMAIMQHALGTDKGFPKPEMVHNTTTVPGPLVDSLVTLLVGDHEFTEESEGFLAERKPCADGRTLYQYNWTGVDASVLDEP